MPTDTREIGFEEFIEKALVKRQGYRSRSPQRYDKKLCMDTELVLEFVQSTQPQAWQKLVDQHGERAAERLLNRIDEEIVERGLLDVLRKGVADHGVRFDLAYFAPETSLNEETRRLYAGNIFSVMRQVSYSERNENTIDMVLLLNGLPLWSAELKNQLTGQSVKNGIMQYKTDRDPREKLLSFKRCLAHFAVDTEQAFVTTRLAGLRTQFLPFNKGHEHSAGNPPNPDGYKTAYLWEDIWTRASTLDIVGRFMQLQIDEVEDERGRTTRKEQLIFPRYHQLDTVRRLVADARNHGAGKNYLIQHSAGSGKSNTIAWTAHRLSELHGADDQPVFDSVVVITDRRILDRQLSETVSAFAQVRGVVVHVESGKELQEALERGDRIISSTLQKFPVIVQQIGELPSKRFAVIVDEAHSSQTGEASKSLKAVLAAKDLDAAARADDDSRQETMEDKILKEMRARRGKTGNLSFFAFTATPKQKTLELFGVQDPTNGKFYPFSLYSMRQAIQERFILDVLKNYTTYEVYFSLLKRIQDDPEFDRAKAQRLLVGYVERHEHAIEKKVAIMVEHFHVKVARQIGGQAKAMVVTKSRLHAVRYKQAMDRYLAAHGYPYKALVAFSGAVRDGGVEYTETQMNGVPERNTAREYKKPEYKFLIVAEKFQTGFDQPLLSVMYVDKKLSGVNAVQALSRLNRIHPGKDEVLVLDFVNETDDIKEAFQPYYTTTVLSEATDPNILHDLQRDLLSYKLFTEQEVNAFAEQYFNGATPAVINAFLDAVIERLEHYLPEEIEQLRTKLSDYIRKYAFVAQIVPFEDVSLEKLYVFSKFLRKKLPVGKNPLPYEVLEAIDMESYKVVKVGHGSIALQPAPAELEPMGAGGAGVLHDERDPLSKIVKEINERFGTTFTLEDRVILHSLSQRLMGDKGLMGSIRTNTRDAAKIKFDVLFQEQLVDMLSRHFDLYKKLDASAELKAFVGEKIFDYIQRKVIP